MVADFVDKDATDDGAVEIDGTSWTRWTDPGRDPDADPSVASEGDLALVRRSGDATTLVVGTVAEDELTTFAKSLR
jgi:hypothetical protein